MLSLLAGRYLLGLRRRTHVAAVSAVSFWAMALGAAALVLTLALLEGFQATIRQQLAQGGVHTELRPKSGRSLPEGDWIGRMQARHPDILVRAIVGGTVWCISGDAAQPAAIEVVDTLSRVEVSRVLAAQLGIGVGGRLTLASARTTLTPLGPMPVRRSCQIGAVVTDGNEPRSFLRVPTNLGDALLGRRAPSVVRLSARDPKGAWEVASLVQSEVPEGVEVISFRELNRPLLAALQLERVMIGLGVALVMVVAALNLLCNLALLGAEKRADVAVLAAQGLHPKRIFRLFMVLGLGVGALGGLFGTLLGWLVAFVLDATHALPLQKGAFIVSHVPFKVTPGMLGVVVAISVLAAFLASLSPARAAARRDVLEGIRYE